LSLLYSSGAPLALHSFPTRRSSDLSCIDGVRDLTPLDDRRYDAVLETKVAYMTFKFKVTVELTEVTVPERIAAKIEGAPMGLVRSEEHTSELQSRENLVCRLLLEKK